MSKSLLFILFQLIYSNLFCQELNHPIPSISCTEPCKSKLNISTGYNSVSSTPLTPGNVDNNWKVTLSSCTLPSCVPICPSVVIDRLTNPSYLNPFGNLNWISYAVNYNLGLPCDITFEREFYLNQADVLTGTIEIACDNGCDWELIKPNPIPITAGSYPQNGSSNFKTYKKFTYNSQSQAKCGKYILRIKVHNASGPVALLGNINFSSKLNSLSNSNGCCLKCN